MLECGDATEVESVLDVAQAVNGPVYVRMLRGEVTRWFDPAEPLRLGVARTLSEGDDIAVLSSGLCTEAALRAVAALRQRGVSITHLHVSTLKPFTDPRVLAALHGARRGVVTLENHSIIGGLGAAVAETMAEQGIGTRLIRLGLRDTYAHGASMPYLLREYGLDAHALIAAVERLIDERFDLRDSDLIAPDRGPWRAATQPIARGERVEDL